MTLLFSITVAELAIKEMISCFLLACLKDKRWFVMITLFIVHFIDVKFGLFGHSTLWKLQPLQRYALPARCLSWSVFFLSKSILYLRSIQLVSQQHANQTCPWMQILYKHFATLWVVYLDCLSVFVLPTSQARLSTPASLPNSLQQRPWFRLVMWHHKSLCPVGG